jgi:hypothetical protein
MAALNLYQFKNAAPCQFENGAANATSSAPAAQENIRPSGGSA